MGGRKRTPGNYCLYMRVIKRLLLRNATVVMTSMGWVFNSDVRIYKGAHTMHCDMMTKDSRVCCLCRDVVAATEL